MTPEPTALAHDLLVAVKTGEPTRPYEEALAELDDLTLVSRLPDDEAGLAFWIDVYNAYAQLLLDRYPGLYEESRRRFFGHEAIPVAGQWLSLDDIEHGILRPSQWSLGLGYVPKPFPTEFERRHRLDHLDPRIHFALNCGAASCPPIRAYEREQIDAQLDLATASYLEGEVEYDAEASVVRVPRLMLWYRGDFGGRSGILETLRAQGLLPVGAEPSLTYGAYDWSKAPGEFPE